MKLNYRNYASYGKGCCNYVTLVNQNVLGIDNALYNDFVPSSSTLFYQNYNSSTWNDITVYISNNFTSLTSGDEYYNLLLDQCMFEIYNYLDYDPYAFTAPGMAHYNGPASSETCNNLIKAGIY